MKVGKRNIQAVKNINLQINPIKAIGYSWSLEGLGSMLNALIHRFEGTLVEAIQNLFTSDHPVKEEPEEYPSVASILTEKTRESIGAIQGHIPALVGDDQHKPYARALRGLARF